VKAGTKYWYRLVATAGSQESPPSGVTQVTTLSPNTRPPKPRR
jgi:hypothetical protein